jgi:hypothetical protein
LLAPVKHVTSFELVIGRFREPHPVPSGHSANHAQRRSGPSTESSASIGFQVREPQQYPWFAGPRTTCSYCYTRSAGLRTPRGPQLSTCV